MSRTALLIAAALYVLLIPFGWTPLPWNMQLAIWCFHGPRLGADPIDRVALACTRRVRAA